MKWLVDNFLWRIYHGGEQLMIYCELFCTFKEIKMYSSLSLSLCVPKKTLHTSFPYAGGPFRTFVIEQLAFLFSRHTLH